MVLGDSAVRVGIGTSSPGYKLQVLDSSNTGLRVQTDTAGGTVASFASNGKFEVDAPFSPGGRFQILENGNVGIGSVGASDKLQVFGDIRVGSNALGCVKDGDGTVIAGVCSSDARLKTNVEPFDPMLDKVSQLQPVHFNWRAAEFPDLNLGASTSFGLIAQDVEKVMPELVTEDAKGFKAVKYNEIPLMLLQAIRELKAENDSLREELGELKRGLNPQK
jgi:endosialidase-like protein